MGSTPIRSTIKKQQISVNFDLESAVFLLIYSFLRDFHEAVFRIKVVHFRGKTPTKVTTLIASVPVRKA